MIDILKSLVKNIKTIEFLNSDIIPWGSPIISFGNISNSKIATLGINPSNREFVNLNGNELTGNERRFHTLDSLNLKEWAEADQNHIDLISNLCEEYFFRNPYDGWFKKLDYIISGTSMSYYFPSTEACHLDLIPYATSKKWSELTLIQKNSLLNSNCDFLGKILKKSKLETIILNGQTVVENLEKVSDTNLTKTEMKNWTLNRKNSNGVKGYSYKGYIQRIGHIHLNRKIRVLGFNHNIQSSFGVSSKVQLEIRNWISSEINISSNESK